MVLATKEKKYFYFLVNIVLIFMRFSCNARSSDIDRTYRSCTSNLTKAHYRKGRLQAIGNLLIKQWHASLSISLFNHNNTTTTVSVELTYFRRTGTYCRSYGVLKYVTRARTPVRYERTHVYTYAVCVRPYVDCLRCSPVLFFSTYCTFFVQYGLWH